MKKNKNKKQKDTQWAVGWKDRFHGHGDYGVIDEKGEIIAELSSNINQREHAFLIVKACNHYNELLGIAKELLGLVDSEVIDECTTKIANYKRRLQEIEDYNKKLEN